MAIFKDAKKLDLDYIPDEETYFNRELNGGSEFINMAYEGNSHVLCFGFAGSGKTSTLVRKMKVIPQTITRRAIYLNMKDYTSELQAIQQINTELGLRIRGRSIGTFNAALVKSITSLDMKVLIIMDEIDKYLSKSGDNLFYNLLETPGISIVLITNDVTASDMLTPRVKSRLGGPPKVMFRPYNALELRQILDMRVKAALHEGVIDSATLSRMAAIAAQEHGDARKAIATLKACAILAETRGTKITPDLIDLSDKTVNIDEVKSIIDTFPLQAKATLKAICSAIRKVGALEITSTDMYMEYEKIITQMGLRALTSRRIADYIWDIEHCGLIETRKFGKFGGTKSISLRDDIETIEIAMKEE